LPERNSFTAQQADFSSEVGAFGSVCGGSGYSIPLGKLMFQCEERPDGRSWGLGMIGGSEVVVVSRVIGIARANPWSIASLVTAVVVAVVSSWPLIGVILLVGYALLNSCGVAIFCDGLRHRRAPLQLTLRLLSVVLVPVGVMTAPFTRGGLTPSEASSSGSPDENTRRAAAATRLVSLGVGPARSEPRRSVQRVTHCA
jgi:hypothetical protein